MLSDNSVVPAQYVIHVAVMYVTRLSVDPFPCCMLLCLVVSQRDKRMTLCAGYNLHGHNIHLSLCSHILLLLATQQEAAPSLLTISWHVMVLRGSVLLLVFRLCIDRNLKTFLGVSLQKLP